MPESEISQTLLRRRLRKADWAAAAGLALIVGFLFAPGLFLPGDRVLSSPYCDVFNYFASSRQFGFGELQNGNLALWNPHILSGTPYLGNFQSALLYPPNLMYLLLPLAKALNADMAFHVFLAGLLMYAWARNRRQRPAAAFFAGAVLMLSQTFFLRVFAGHLTVLGVLAWTPLVFLAVDKLFDRPSLGGCLTGIFAVTMQILAGLPQGVFCTVVAVGIYCLLRIGPCRNRRATIIALIPLAVVPLLLSAAQLWPGIATAYECTRSGGLPFDRASAGSFPPENFLTLFVPRFFESYARITHWGPCALWESSLFIGIAGFVLAVHGAVYGRNPARRAGGVTPPCYWIAMILVLFIIALGSFTPLYRLFYLYVPGVSRFRMPARFMFFAVLFLALLAGAGASALFDKRGNGAAAAAMGTAILSVLFAAAALTVVWAAAGPKQPSHWRHFVDALYAMGGVNSLPAHLSYDTLRAVALKGLINACAVSGVLAGLLWMSRTHSWAVYGIIAIGVFELLWVDRAQQLQFPLSATKRADAVQFYKENPGDFRVLNMRTYANLAQTLGKYDIWGYDPVVLQRYSEFIAFTQKDPSAHYGPGDEPAFKYIHPLLSLVRCRFILLDRETGLGVAPTYPPLPHVLLLHDYRVIAESKAILDAMNDPAFDPRSTVILESPPDPPPAPSDEPGAVDLVERSSDELVLDVDTPSPAILLITDAYANGWRARPLSPGPQQEYHLQRADDVLRAIPLAAGKHHILVEYSPWAFRAGRAVSLVTLLVFLAAVAYCVRQHANRMRRSDG